MRTGISSARQIPLILRNPKLYYLLTVKNPTRCNSVIRILLFLILNEARHVSGDTLPIIRSLKLHKQPLVLHNTVEGCRTCGCWTLSGSVYAAWQHPTTATSCWIFHCKNCTMMHGSTNIKFYYLITRSHHICLGLPNILSFFQVSTLDPCVHFCALPYV